MGDSTPQVTIEAGVIGGTYEESERVAVFKGIPYARPPIGNLRWRPPQPVDAWDGVRPAMEYSAAAYQRGGDSDVFFRGLMEGQGVEIDFDALMSNMPAEVQSEDCLYLNIRTPSLDSKDRLPVMVWIHGGGHQDGSGTGPAYNTNTLPQKGVVLVTINYRLGILGYFAHPDLSRESESGVSGNYGTLDQIAALNWVQRNISGFGGDPGNVTIFGESAGGESVAHLLCSPLAKGLFHKAIMQSPATTKQMMHLRNPFLGYPAAETAGAAFAASLLESSDANVDDLRLVSARDLVNASIQEDRWDVFYPVIDGHILPESPFLAFLEGNQAKVPLLLGSNSDEGILLFPIIQSPLMEYGPAEPEEIQDIIRDAFSQDADTLIRLYPGLDAGSQQAAAALLGEYMFNSKTRFYADRASKWGQSAFLYLFSRVPPSPKQTIGAAHAAEIPFVFDSHIPIFPVTQEDRTLTETMGRYWTNFAKSADPNEAGLEEWPRYSDTNPMQMNLGYRLGPIGIEKADRFSILDRRLLRLIEDMKQVKAGNYPLSSTQPSGFPILEHPMRNLI